MTDDSESAPSDSDGSTTYAPGLSDDGVVLALAAAACLLAAGTASSTGQPQPVVVFAGVAGTPAVVAFLADALSEYVPGTGVELLVVGAALVGAAFAAPGRHYVNVATLAVAAALVGWRIYDVEFRDAER